MHHSTVLEAQMKKGRGGGQEQEGEAVQAIHSQFAMNGKCGLAS